MTKKCDPNVPYNDLPHLPPEKSLFNDISLWELEAKARSCIAELKGLANIIPNQSILINAIVLEEAKDSSEIENIITTRDKLYNGIYSDSKKVDKSTEEVIHYRKALMYGFGLIKTQGFLRKNDIDKIQEIIVGNKAGLRKTPGTALVNDKTNEIVFTPPEPQILEGLMGNIVDFFNTCESTLINMAILHFQFETIHPYYDGNGRTGRILNILYMISKEQLDIPILYLSSYITANKKDYYRLLNKVTIEREWSEWIQFVLKGIISVSKDTIQKVKLIKNEIDKILEVVKKEKPKIYSKELVEALFEHPYCKIEFIVSSIGVERKAASRYLNQLVDIGVLSKHQIGKEHVFVNEGLMTILKS
jgi:Fic family protein